MSEKQLRNYIRLMLEAQEYPTQATIDKMEKEKLNRSRSGGIQNQTDHIPRNPVGEYKIHVKDIKKNSPIVSAIKKIALSLGIVTLPAAIVYNAISADSNQTATTQQANVKAKEILDAGMPELDLEASPENVEDTPAKSISQVIIYNYDHSNIDRNYVIDTLEIHEGFRSKPYYDSKGYVTVGYGTKIEGVAQNTNLANQTLVGTAASDALKKLGDAEDSYTYVEGATEISQSDASTLLGEKFDTIFASFRTRIGDNFRYLPKELKEMLADMSYNMGAQFFSGSNFIKDVKRLAALLNIAVNSPNDLTQEQKTEIRSLISYSIPANMIDSTYFDDLTSPNDESASGRPNPANAEQVLQVINSYTGRPINLLNHYLPVINSSSTIFESKNSLKGAYNNLFS